MKIPLAPEYHYEINRLTHWWRVYLGDPNKPTILLISASKTYLDDAFKVDSLNTDLTPWVEKVVSDWLDDNDLYMQPVHYLVFANFPDGYKNGIDFLKNEIKQ